MAWHKGRNKFGNKRELRDGRSFGSGLEAAVYDLLKKQLADGLIANIRQQSHIKLTDADILYIADFKIENLDGSFHYVEAKGYETDVWKLKKRLYICYGPAPLLIYKGSKHSPKLVETIIPKGL